MRVYCLLLYKVKRLLQLVRGKLDPFSTDFMLELDVAWVTVASLAVCWLPILVILLMRLHQGSVSLGLAALLASGLVAGLFLWVWASYRTLHSKSYRAWAREFASYTARHQQLNNLLVVGILLSNVLLPLWLLHLLT